MFEEYYLNNGQCDLINAAFHANVIWTPGMKPLRNLPGFEAAVSGTYESGDFTYSFLECDVIPLSAKESAETMKIEVEIAMPLKFSMRRHGFREKELDQMQKDKDEEKKSEGDLLGNNVLNAMRNRDQGVQ